MDITNLEEQRRKLSLKRDVNSVKINQYDRLITYYLTLYEKTLTSIDKKTDDINLYESIIAFKKRISSPKILERISFISDEYLLEKISELRKSIDALLSESDYLDRKATQRKEEKLGLEDTNATFEGKIAIVDDNIKCYGLTRKRAK